MKNRRRFRDLTIRDNFMFAAVMMQEENCKKFLEMLSSAILTLLRKESIVILLRTDAWKTVLCQWETRAKVFS